MTIHEGQSPLEILRDRATSVLLEAKGETPANPAEVTVVNLNPALVVYGAADSVIVRADVATRGSNIVPVTIAFDPGFTEPTNFVRWDKIRKDNGEGKSVRKEQRPKIAQKIIELFGQ